MRYDDPNIYSASMMEEKLGFEGFRELCVQRDQDIHPELFCPQTPLTLEVTTFNFFYLTEQINAIAERLGFSNLQIEPFPKSLFSDPTFHPKLREAIEEHVRTIQAEIDKAFPSNYLQLSINPNLYTVIHNLCERHSEKHVDPGYDAYKDVLRGLGALFNQTFVGPRRLLIDPTLKCNLDCYYCRSHSPETRSGPEYKTVSSSHEFKFGYLQENITKIHELGVEQIAIVGSGDPLIYPAFHEMLELVAKHELLISFSTNGVLLQPDRIKDTIPKMKGAATFSISATAASTYKKIHPQTTNEKMFDVLLDKLQSFNRIKKESGNTSLQSIFLFVITKDNYHEIRNVSQFACELGFDMVQFQLLHVENFSTDLRLTKDETEKVIMDLKIAKAQANRLGLTFSDYIEIQLEELDKESGTYSVNAFDTYGCLVGWQFAYLDHVGVVSLCCGKKYIDTVYDKAFDELWNSRTYMYYRDAARRMDAGVKTIYGPLITNFCKYCDNINFQKEIVDSVELLLQGTDDDYYQTYSGIRK